VNAGALAAYAFAVALALGWSAWLLERALTSLRLPARWVWLGALVLSIWLPLASFASGPRQGGASDATGMAEVVAPIVPTEVVEVTIGGPEERGAAVLDRLTGFGAGMSRLLASGAALIPPVGLSPARIAGAWGAASLLVGMILLASLLRLHRRARRWPEEELLGRRVKLSPDLGPATVGLLRPVIVIPHWAGKLPRQELDLVLRHEDEHVRTRDTLLLALGLVAVVACPWNPLVWWQVRRLRAAVEMDCDRRVLRTGVAPAAYGELLVRLGSRGRLGSLAVPTIAGSTSLLERRLIMMRSIRRRTTIPAALAATGVALLLVVVACTSEPPVATDTRAASTPDPATNTDAASEPRLEDVVAIRVDLDGTVRVNGVVHPLDRVSEVVAPLDPKKTVISLESHQEAPYRVVAALQEQLRVAGHHRVVFVTFASEDESSPPRDVATLVDHGLPVVLPDTTMANLSQVNVNPRNLLFLEVLPTGVVATRRGADPTIREMAPQGVEALWRREVALNPNLIALVQTHPDAEYRYMYDVLDALQRAEATRFALQVAE
jgi:biopolymer transport protein ExbD